jgi:DNA mismatch repair protein MutL
MNIIHILAPEEARKIAAGEVIDRPAALVREFMDNAIDSGARFIDVSIADGGIRSTEVSDDGCGMSKDDLNLCCLTHATSKIATLDDLSELSTLGFRGEALAAASAVARMEIVTSLDGKEAWRLVTLPPSGAGPKSGGAFVEAGRRTKGSSVTARNLFDTVPARKRFLKRPGSEALLCRQIFIEKALAYPAVNFRFLQDGALKLFFPAVEGLRDRFAAAALDGEGKQFLHEIAASGKGFSVTIVVGGPELSRNDRRQQYIFANHRRINDFALQQALEYGTQGYFPNGSHPIGAVFIEIDPALADFNVHPAKREARFSDAATIHHQISSSLLSFFHQIGLRDGPKTDEIPLAQELISDLNDGPHPPGGGRYLYPDDPPSSSYYGEELGDIQAEYDVEGAPHSPLPAPFRYLGCVFGLFLLVESGEKLYLIDQHAAHERLLYDRFLSKPILKQELLVPIAFNTDSAENDGFLASKKAELARLGVIIAGGGGSWRIDALPAEWRLGDGETVEAILELREAGENIAERWAATLACHGCVRDGEILDGRTARDLAAEALKLPVQRCPHGRPILTEITRSDLLKAVKRTG